MAAGQGDMEKFEECLANGQELAALHSELKYTAVHAAADFGAEEPLKWLIRTKVTSQQHKMNSLWRLAHFPLMHWFVFEYFIR